MKEELYTIPLNDAVHAEDECAFCFIERMVEQDLMDYCLGSGSSYMQADMRDKTDEAGFCRRHYHAMLDYGNTLGNAWILKTHTKRVLAEYRDAAKSFRPGKVSLADRLSGKKDGDNAIVKWVKRRTGSCYICGEFERTYDRYLSTFFYLWKEDSAFRETVLKGKGFCLPHFGDLMAAAERNLSGNELQEFCDRMIDLTEQNLERIHEDVAWLVEKFDYKNKDADWKNSRDALPRTMQKLQGGHPADPPYKSAK
jgi:hypothetical protein